MVHIGVIIVLLAANFFIWTAAQPREFTISFFDVGQGDAVFIESPTGVQMLIDGGADRSVLRELGETMSFFDRSIDVVVATHPDTDHVGGLSDVFERYEVAAFIESGAISDTAAFHALESAVEGESAVRVTARAGMRLVLGGGAYADVLFPDRDVSKMESNAASIVMRVVYGNTEFMLTGDSPKAIEGVLVSRHGDALQSDVLKAGHHGSKTSSGEHFVSAVAPQYVVYSRGCENRYGHPAHEVVAVFQTFNVTSLDTCENGTITFHSNGRILSVK